MLRVQFAEDALDVTAGAVVVAGVLLLTLEIEVERGNGDDSDFLAVLLDDAFFRCLLLQIDRIPPKLDNFGRAPAALTDRQDFQANYGIFFAE